MPKFTVIYSRNFSGSFDIIAPDSEAASDAVYEMLQADNESKDLWPDETNIIDVTEVS